MVIMESLAWMVTFGSKFRSEEASMQIPRKEVPGEGNSKYKIVK